MSKRYTVHVMTDTPRGITGQNKKVPSLVPFCFDVLTHEIEPLQVRLLTEAVQVVTIFPCVKIAGNLLKQCLTLFQPRGIAGILSNKLKCI